MRKKALAFTADVLAAAILLGGIYGVNYLIPQKGVSAQVMTAKASGSSQVKAGDPESTEETNRTVETTETAASTSSQERATFLQDIIDSNPSGLPTTHFPGRPGLASEVCGQIYRPGGLHRYLLYQPGSVHSPDL